MKTQTLNKNYLFIFILLSLTFFALNSILCKAALLNHSIDPYSFTFFRLVSAMVMLLVLYFYKHKKVLLIKEKNWISSFMLFIYAVAFSYAYINIDAGVGALILFAVVQIVMVISSIVQKERFSLLKLFGIVVSFSGLIYLIYPKESFELSLFHVGLMTLSGLGWAFYSLFGKKSFDSFGNTTDNCLKASLYITIFYFVFPIKELFFTNQGLLLAIISGSITSALGYLIWYFVLPQIKIVTASVVQLFVPVIAIVLSVIFLDELLTFDLVISTIIVTLGIVMTIYSNTLSKQYQSKE